MVDESHRMVGIFTHDNFARHFQKVERIADRAVGEFLTKKQATVGEGRLAADVLRVLEQHRVDEVVGVDGAGMPVGLVDSQDLARWRLA